VHSFIQGENGRDGEGGPRGAPGPPVSTISEYHSNTNYVFNFDAAGIVCILFVFIV